jgi:hypothetical protein
MAMEDKWEYKKTIIEGEPYIIKGLNIWDSTWNNTGEKIQIKDPIYGQEYVFSIFEITKDQITIPFAAGEFSNSIWGLYEKKTNSTTKKQ